MIYTVIAIDPDNGDETVMSTYDVAESATRACERYKHISPRLSFRVDTINANNDVREHNMKTLVQGLSWKVGDPEPALKRFTARELFPPAGKGYLDRERVPVSDCQECGAYVKIPMHTKHAEWHNKIADL